VILRLAYLRGMIVSLAGLLVVGIGTLAPQFAAAQTATQAGSDVVLHAADLETIVPKTVFFRGQSAPTQLRNAGGIKFGDGMFFFAVPVDTSGYSTGVQAKYQSYLITEVPLQIGGQHLVPGAYGIGFIADHKFLVMDIGAHDLFTVTDEQDTVIKRPTPLQVLAGGKAGDYRLYQGRDFVKFQRASQ
jgi:hypothetical protein